MKQMLVKLLRTIHVKAKIDNTQECRPSSDRWINWSHDRVNAAISPKRNEKNKNDSVKGDLKFDYTNKFYVTNIICPRKWDT